MSSDDLKEMHAQRDKLKAELDQLDVTIQRAESKRMPKEDVLVLKRIGDHLKSMSFPAVKGGVTPSQWFDKQSFAVRDIQLGLQPDNVSVGILSYSTSDGWKARLTWNSLEQTGTLVSSRDAETHIFPTEQLNSIASWVECEDFCESIEAYYSHGWHLALVCARCDSVFQCL